ncbi:hypothetical protein CIK76_18880 [Glutamicibacter sp. BW80]|uniref:DUF4913 domain-containing protein n=1 Tax=Glutamicibacter sp. BW80 TaxID=2024404 RepID=UPI000BB6BE12|nr:DUF4913 domain-containing protein [Glutamicibacter sp. BW80]PCC27060.1 hypothetical protein CIK76_18880 [Glutamicibacter sp. BW80]
MSDWGDDPINGNAVQQFEPAEDDWSTFAQPTSEQASSSVSATHDLTDPAIQAARTNCDDAKKKLRAAQTALVAGEDALADAKGQTRVAELKLADVTDDEASKPWQIAAAEEDHAKKKRSQVRVAGSIDRLKHDVIEAEKANSEAIKILDAATKAAQTPTKESSEDETLVYGSADEFYREFLRNAYRRSIDGRQTIWDAKWWNYAEAVIRIDALWRSWETLRNDPSMGMSVWFRDHADHHMAVLMDEKGPFASAEDISENKCRKGQPLPYTTPPDGLFPDERLK